MNKPTIILVCGIALCLLGALLGDLTNLTASAIMLCLIGGCMMLGGSVALGILWEDD